jgi:hypothetical protein
VFQPDGDDALIRQYKLVGLASQSEYLPLDGLSLRLRPVFKNGVPAFILDIRNASDCALWVRTDEIGITVLGTAKSYMSPSDGASEAVLTRSSLFVHGERGWRTEGGLLHAGYTISGLSVLADRVELAPHGSFQVKLTFDISPGEYQILFGYGGGVHETASLASNAILFTLGPSGAAVVQTDGLKLKGTRR